MTFLHGETGRVVFDLPVSAETARAGLKPFREHVGGDLPIKAVAPG